MARMAGTSTSPVRRFSGKPKETASERPGVTSIPCESLHVREAGSKTRCTTRQTPSTSTWSSG